MREPVMTSSAPPPAGSYSQAMRAGDLVFLAGQTPRRPDGTRIGDRPFPEQVRQTMENLRNVAAAAGGSLADAVRVGVFLRAGVDAQAFDAVYRDYVTSPFPARTTTVSDLAAGDVEVDAILWLPARAEDGRPAAMPLAGHQHTAPRNPSASIPPSVGAQP